MQSSILPACRTRVTSTRSFLTGLCTWKASTATLGGPTVGRYNSRELVRDLPTQPAASLCATQNPANQREQSRTMLPTKWSGKPFPNPATRRSWRRCVRGCVKPTGSAWCVDIIPDGTHVRGGDFRVLEVYDELRHEGQLSVRFQIAARLQPATVSNVELKKIANARRRYHDEWISTGAAKFFLDGLIESHTAAMLAPYSNETKQTGRLLWSPENYKRAVAKLDADHLQIFTHAIGDRAVRLALDAYEEPQKTNRTRDSRSRIEHIETISAEDIPRFGKLGVIASFQPLHAYPDEDLLKVWLSNVGPERAQRGFAWHSVTRAGGVLAFGSDWPIVTLNPWPGVQNALTRQTTEGNPPGGFLPGERISLEDAIKAYTLGAAFAGRRESEEGSLEAGKLADLIVVNQDLFKIEPTEIGKTEVLLTMVGGKVVYESAAWKTKSSGRTEGKRAD